jgi:hypothetical protein
MDPTILQIFLCIELGIVLGHYRREIEEWLRDGRRMVMVFVQALGRSR